MDKTLVINNLTVNRGDKTVFGGLSIDLNPKQILKLVGPNGSGKSTLLKTIAGLIGPQSGSITVNGQSLIGETERISENICYLGHKNALKKEFTVAQNIEFWAKLWDANDQIITSINKMGIAYLQNTPVRYLSSGQTRRAALARVLCHPARIWLLDEPTVGLDDQGLKLLSQVMTNHLHKGGMIICATHVDLGLDEEDMKIADLADFAVATPTMMDAW
mgnify:FL=1